MAKTNLKSMLVSVDTTIKRAMKKLNETEQQILFVVDKRDKLIGTVTDGDIRRGIINGQKFNDKLENVMHRNFFSVRSNMSEMPKQAKQLMIKKRIKHIPVLNDEGVIIEYFLWADFLDEEKQHKSRQTKLYSNQVVIMAGGKGSRLDMFTKILPKALIPLGDKPAIEIIMESFYKYGFYKFIYTLNYKKEYLKLFFKENNFPYNIDWVEEDQVLGTAGSLSLLGDTIEDTFFVSNCDSLLDVNFEDAIKWHREHDATITILGSHSEVKIPFGVIEISNGKLDRILEKPVHDVIINTGVYVMEPHIISYIPKNKFLDMNMLIDLVAKKENVTVFPVYGSWFDIGQWEEYKKSKKHFEGLSPDEE